MYMPPAFEDTDPASLRAAISGAGLANLVTATAAGPFVTPLPLLYDGGEGENGVLHGHLARANPHWRQEAIGESIAVFMGPDAYVTPSWYATKRETGKVVPTWNYVTVHVHGRIEFYHDPARLLETVTGLTRRHESERPSAWEVSDAPADYIAAQLRGIVGLRMEITRIEGKRKMSQNRSAEDRLGVAEGLSASANPAERQAGALIQP